MFSISNRLRNRFIGLTFSLGIALGVGLVPHAAHAATENYAWTDANKTAITVSGGTNQAGNNLDAKGTLKPLASSPGTFTGMVSFVCGTNTAESALLTVLTDTTTGSTGAVSWPTSANCADFDSTVAIANSDGTLGVTPIPATLSTNCNDGTFSWIVCPFTDNVTSAITSIAAKALIPLLKVQTIDQTITPQLYGIWKNVRDLALGLFMLIFMVIIFATITQQDMPFLDHYTIKLVLPRLVIGAILVLASFSISGFIVDIGNVLGGGVQTLFAAGTHPVAAASTANIVTNLIGVALTGIGAFSLLLVVASWIAVAPLLASLFLSLIAVFLVLGLRFLIIALLVALSPIALVAWVLPNTRHWANDWMKVFMRLVMMYPIVIVILTLASKINEILPGSNATTASGGATTAVDLIKPFIVIAAFIAVPTTFRLAGRGLDKAYQFLDNNAKRGQGILKGSDFWKRGVDERQARKNTYMGRVMTSKPITSLSAGNGASRALAGMVVGGASIGLMNAPSSRVALNKSNSKLSRSSKKILEDLDEANVDNLYKSLGAFTSQDFDERRRLKKELQTTAPNLLQIASNASGRAAVMNRLADLGLVNENTWQQFNRAPRTWNPFGVSYDTRSEYPTLASEVGKEAGSKPMVTNRYLTNQGDVEVKNIAGQKIATLNRPVGSLNVNEAVKSASKLKPSTFGDKHHVTNFKVADMRDSKNADQVRDARDVAASYAHSLDAKAVLQPIFDPSTRAYQNTSPEVRLVWARQAAKNNDVYRQIQPQVLQYTTAHLGQDETLTRNLALTSGVNEKRYDQLSPVARVNIAKDYVYGKKYDGWHDYDSGGQASIPVSGTKGPVVWP